MKWIDNMLGKVTPYRLLEYYLIALLGAATVLSAFGVLSYSPLTICIQASYLVLVCWLVNKIFSNVYDAPVNPESSIITALILALIISPIPFRENISFLTVAGTIAVASKYILAINKKHIFNPVAIAVVLTSLAAGQSASWWVGTSALTPVVIIGGLLLARRTQRGAMIAWFIATSLLMSAALSTLAGNNGFFTIQKTVLHSSLLFLAFVMLTEPLTSPGTASKQRWYAILAGALFPPQIHLASLYSTPELALVLSNIYAYIVSSKVKVTLLLRDKLRLTSNVYDIIFQTAKPFDYQPGQYMEWTLPHVKADARGSRRYFTLASSPTESEIRIGLKVYPDSSSYKNALMALPAEAIIGAAQLSGDFILPSDPNRKLVFIAGGIGITPFRSMLKYLIDTDDTRDITLFYAERTAEAFVYHDVIREATNHMKVKVFYSISQPTTATLVGIKQELLNAAVVLREVPAYQECMFYISGPPAMVTTMKHSLRSRGIHARNIKTDFFPGY